VQHWGAHGLRPRRVALSFSLLFVVLVVLPAGIAEDAIDSVPFVVVVVVVVVVVFCC